MNSFSYLIFGVALLVIELVYFWIARYFKILDHPNNRSLHEKPTIRGGGIIFYFSVLLFYAITSRPDGIFMLALTLVSIIGFIDDVKSLSSAIRFAVQAIAFALIFYQLELWSVFSDPEISPVPAVIVPIVFIVCVGAINTFNFMDGINGITGGYALVALGSLLAVNIHFVHFVDSDFVEAILMAVIIFCYFNFRTKAICFAGDVGSLSIGFIILYLIVKLIVTTGNFAFAFMLSVYGVDSVLTIIHRIFRRENIFKAHKLHLFQVLVHHYKIPHIRMSIAYALLQLIINCIIIYALDMPQSYQYIIGLGILITLAILYASMKRTILKAE
ncbi:MAG: glycosyltransferase family 4 protein [Cyclobacteriaceae bacterium]|nr:glycosyltransferase family 4 protein [Cyclobacteriaceae bacterium]